MNVGGRLAAEFFVLFVEMTKTFGREAASYGRGYSTC